MKTFVNERPTFDLQPQFASLNRVGRKGFCQLGAVAFQKRSDVKPSPNFHLHSNQKHRMFYFEILLGTGILNHFRFCIATCEIALQLYLLKVESVV